MSLEPWPIARSKCRRAANRTSCQERSTRPAGLVGQRGAAVVADRVVADPEPLAELERLREVARGDLDLVALLLEAPDDRRQHEHVRRVGEVDPDLHAWKLSGQAAASAATTSSACARVNTGLIGSARFVRASSSVTGSSSAAPLRSTYGAIAGWRCSGTR